MSTPIDPELERTILTAIRAPLVAAVDAADTTARNHVRSQRRVVVACAALLVLVGAVAAWHATDGGGKSPHVEVGPTTTAPVTTTTPAPDQSDPTGVDVGIVGSHVVHLRNVPISVGSSIGNGVTETRNGRFVAYEYGTPVVHDVAVVAVDSCTNGCTETPLGRGHSPVFAADGRLAYVALDDVPPTSATQAMWNRAGSVTVRAPDGTTQVWAHGTGFQTVGWAGTTLLVEHDVASADTEGFEELQLYRGPGNPTVLSQGLVAISPDGARLLLGANGTNQMLQLYDVESRRVVSSISIADYERALVPQHELAGVDLTKWPGFEEPVRWPISCCDTFSGPSLWHDDLVLLPTTRHITHRSGGEPDRWELRPTLLRIAGNRIVPLRTLRIVGTTDEYDAARWARGSTTEFVLKRSDLNPPHLAVCRIDGSVARCTDDQSAATVLRLPATIP